MACYFFDNVYSSCFTPKEYQIDLLEAAKHENTVVCFGTSFTKFFIALKLLHEFANDVRKPLTSGGKRTIFISSQANIRVLCIQIKLLTDLEAVTLTDTDNICASLWDSIFEQGQVILLTKPTFQLCVTSCLINFSNVNLLIIDDCQTILFNESFRKLFIDHNDKKQLQNTRILGLTSIVLHKNFNLAHLEADFNVFESVLNSHVNTSSDIVSVLRFSSQPREVLVECQRPVASSITDDLHRLIAEAESFLHDHRYDPYEIYEDEFREELQGIPDPKIEPHSVFEEFRYVLDNLGVWCADRAALALLIKIEKLKIKTPYERHFLLLCMASSVMVSVRARIEQAFLDLTDGEAMDVYTTPKIKRLLEVLQKFKPPNAPVPEIATPSEADAPTAAGDVPEAELPDKGPDIVAKTRYFDQPKARQRRNAKKSGLQRPLLRNANLQDDSFCAVVFVKLRFVAKIIYELIHEASRSKADYSFITVQYTVDKIRNPATEFREAEMEHKKQEEVLRKFRVRECNLLVATSVLEEGIDIPKCNLVIRFDLPETYASYVQSKGRARASEAHYVLLVEESELEEFTDRLAQYMEVEKVFLRKCGFDSVPSDEEREADEYTTRVVPFRPLADDESAATVGLDTAISLVNKYCAKLPSDTFTRLAPTWWIKSHKVDGAMQYQCILRLPINSPLKKPIEGSAMSSKLLACRTTALLTCRLLYEAGELDDNLMPIGKENFKAYEDDWNNFPLEEADEILTKDNVEPRPGTTKRRQYYYKKIADALTNCRPQAGETSYLYNIKMILTCPLPEEQNTRGRKIYPPEDSPQGFGILTSKPIPTVCTFPIFTRSGEVHVSLELCSSSETLSDDQIEKIHNFLHYTFTSVLKLQKYLMMFDPKASENSYFIVPTNCDENGKVFVDWDFVEKIFNVNKLDALTAEEDRANFQFESEMYRDAVVMPWYRNQDQPQYFYVAEICYHLNPKSDFPGTEYATFEEYYFRKYNIQIQNKTQPLLDVDHTSARLNFLTPRYVNRKGVALPTSSEETKRAKRENLEQKQILVPELCKVHPFSSSLWRKAVCLPCVLYRVNALLLADEIRKQVARDLYVGRVDLDPGFEWPSLNFGWCLADVLKKSRDQKQQQLQQQLELLAITKGEEDTTPVIKEIKDEDKNDCKKSEDGDNEDDEEEIGIAIEGDVGHSQKECWEIGTWSNDMASDVHDGILCTRYGTPPSLYNSDSEDSYSDDSLSSGGFRIAFTSENVAEAIEEDEVEERKLLAIEAPPERADDDEEQEWVSAEADSTTQHLIDKFHEATVKNKAILLSDEMLCRSDAEFVLKPKPKMRSEPSLYVIPAEHAEPAPLPAHNCCAPPSDDILTRNCDNSFSFDYQPDLMNHPGPSPSIILQALTMSNANDGINLERLETIGDSFLKYAITNYLYSTYENIHEGKLSHLRSKQVSNLNLYRLGKQKNLGETMIATKFDPHDNWLPPCFYVPREFEQALIEENMPAGLWNTADLPSLRDKTSEEITELVKETAVRRGRNEVLISELLDIPCFIPYNLITQHSIPDKSIADCVEALIGAYLIECGPRGALLFMAWLGIRVLPVEPTRREDQRVPGSTLAMRYGELPCPRSPLLRHVPDPEGELERLLDGFDEFERILQYRFHDRSYLLQALSHASYSPNTVTDCYQRLEFLGDAVLDYLITRHLYEDPRMHSPGALTDLRSALVNNTIFASLAVRYSFHKYFRHLSPGLHEVVDRFVRIQYENGHSITEDCYLIEEDECEQAEDVEVPKALGDVFESVAGAIFLDSKMSLDAVWKVYYEMMKNEIEQFSMNVPKSPIRELLELEPETAKFSKPEKLADGRKVRVTVEVFGKGSFKGIGRNYRIAKCTAAKCALKQLKKRGLLSRKA